MKKIIVMVFLSILAVLTGYAQENQFTPQEQELINLSNQKWQWMSEKMLINLPTFSMTPHNSYTWVVIGAKNRNSILSETAESGIRKLRFMTRK